MAVEEEVMGSDISISLNIPSVPYYTLFREYSPCLCVKVFLLL